MFPADDILIARGKYSTLSKERREQIERTQKVADTIRKNLLVALLGIQERPTASCESLVSLRACIANWETAWTRVDELNAEMDELRGLAWGDKDE